MWGNIGLASVLIAISVLGNMLLPASWHIPLLWKMASAATGVGFFAANVYEHTYVFVGSVSTAVGIVVFSFEDLSLLWRVLPWFAGLVLLTMLPMTRWMSDIPWSIRLTLMMMTSALTCYVTMVCIGVDTEDAMAFIWISWIAGNLLCFLLRKTSDMLWVTVLFIALQAHLAHAVLALGVTGKINPFYVGLPLLIFYAGLPAFLILKAMAAVKDNATKDTERNYEWFTGGE